MNTFKKYNKVVAGVFYLLPRVAMPTSMRTPLPTIPRGWKAIPTL